MALSKLAGADKKDIEATAECLDDALKGTHGRVASVALDARDVSPVQLSAKREFLLAKFRFLPQGAKGGADVCRNVHVPL